jgi:hypothetical protein
MPEEQKEPEYLSRYEQLLIGQALGTIADALVEQRKYVPGKLGRAIQALTETINAIAPAGEFTEEEANLSANLHTYFRKYEDSHLSSMLWSFVNEGRGIRVWIAFIKDLYENGASKHYHVENGIKRLARPETTDEYAVFHLLAMWEENGGLKSAIEQLLEWECIKPKPVKKP